jgi:hypothetical protein
MPIDRSKMRKGAEAIEAAVEANSNRSYKPWLPSIYWGDDGDEHYVLILNTIEEVPQVDFHPFVDLGDGMPHMIICRTDPIIGERTDPIESEWQYKPRLTNLAIAVELEPVSEVDAKGRAIPVGFEVKTREFSRKILNDVGEPTDETEEVEAPVIGLIAQSPFNFFNQLRDYDASTASIHTTPLKIKRLGKKDVSYTFVGFNTITPDVSNLLDLIENVSYVQGDDKEALLDLVDDAPTEEDACTAIGDFILNLKIDELGDEENYQELYQAITKPSAFPAKGKGKGKDKSESKSRGRTERPKRERRSRTTVDEVSTGSVTEEAPAEEVQETPKARTRKAKDSESTPTTPREERMARLRARSKTQPSSE